MIYDDLAIFFVFVFIYQEHFLNLKLALKLHNKHKQSKVSVHAGTATNISKTATKKTSRLILI